jgi:ribosomal protein L40E
MDISSIFSDAFDYARKMFADLGRLAILIVLDVIPVVNFIVVGYAAKVVKETPSKELPALKDYVDMWVQGLKIVVASIIWMIIPIILIAVGFGLAFFIFPIVIGVVGVILAFCIAIILCMSIVHMVKQNSFGKAFAAGEVLDIIRRIGWSKYILWLIAIFVIGLVIAAIGAIPWVGWLISLIIGPLFAVFAARSASLIYSEAVPTATEFVSGTRYCRNCGAGLTPDAAFCPKCGQKVE